MSASSAAQQSEPASTKVVEKTGAGADSANGPSRTWQLVNVILPIVLTAALGYWVGRKEDKLKQDIDNQSQLFSQQLQLSEELYKRRFDAYEKLYAQLVKINGDLDLESDAEHPSKKIDAEQVKELAAALYESKLHTSDRVEPLMRDAWMSGARGDGRGLTENIKLLEVAMKYELDEWMVAKKEAQPPTASPASSKKKTTKPKSGSSQ